MLLAQRLASRASLSKTFPKRGRASQANSAEVSEK
jgi:hypothetical protein